MEIDIIKTTCVGSDSISLLSQLGNVYPSYLDAYILSPGNAHLSFTQLPMAVRSCFDSCWRKILWIMFWFIMLKKSSMNLSWPRIQSFVAYISIIYEHQCVSSVYDAILFCRCWSLISPSQDCFLSFHGLLWHFLPIWVVGLQIL